LGQEGKKRGRVISGMRPTGRLHIGHYFGALENWVRLQNETVAGGVAREGQAPPLQGQKRDEEKSGHGSTVPLRGGEKSHGPGGDRAYECFYFIADWHALTSDYADTSGVAGNTIEIMTDYLAAGLDPEKSVIFQQSLVPEHAELHLLLSMVTPLSWLERVPTYKEALEQVKDKDLHNYGFLGYPCLQTADIVIYSSPADAGEDGVPLFVPVGEDQVSHVELSREIVRRFDSIYGFAVDFERWKTENLLGLAATLHGEAKLDGSALQAKALTVTKELLLKRIEEEGAVNFVKRLTDENARYVALRDVLTEPGVMLTKTPRIPGLDGRKMSKSYGNAITLSETDEEIRKKTKVMVTDPARKRRTDPGNPDVCPVYDWHKLFSAGEPGRLEWVRQGCTTAGIGCIECKAAMAENLIKWIGPKREARNKWEKDPKGVVEMVDAGSKKARVEAKKTMERVREAVFGWEKKKAEVMK
jgi:tryptophanyl-tRNA synthetase